MAKNKTQPTNASVTDFINAVENEQKRKDSYRLIELMKAVSGEEPYMWGPSIIGFGSYHYKYKSGHEGDAPILGFSPRKAAISLYAFTGLDKHKHQLDTLGKFKMGKACIYVKKLEDIDEKTLIDVMKQTISFIETTYERQ
ncbi:MAG: DUF1801 domain-containing protein [Flavobacteriaceae bacterium]|nr:DUF1801 domain-containing protein [Flavobacteriaceae bacterium]